MSEPIPKHIVLQRLRNRIIEVLELAASQAGPPEHDKSASPIDIPSLVLNFWGDFVGDDWRRHYTAGDVFTPDEIDAIAAFQSAWDEVPDQALALSRDTLTHMPAWFRLIESAVTSLAVFHERGRLPED